MYVPGVSRRNVKASTGELGGQACAASTSSAINKKLDVSLAAFAQRRLDEPCPYLILDARHEKVREGGVVGSQAELIAIGIAGDGRRQILTVERAKRDRATSCKDFLSHRRDRGLQGNEFAGSADKAGSRAGR